MNSATNLIISGPLRGEIDSLYKKMPYMRTLIRKQ